VALTEEAHQQVIDEGRLSDEDPADLGPQAIERRSECSGLRFTFSRDSSWMDRHEVAFHVSPKAGRNAFLRNDSLRACRGSPIRLSIRGSAGAAAGAARSKQGAV